MTPTPLLGCAAVQTTTGPLVAPNGTGAVMLVGAGSARRRSCASRDPAYFGGAVVVTTAIRRPPAQM